MLKRSNAETRKLDDAAKAGWLYYVAGNTQEEIAKKLNVSRQSAQRMVALSVSEGLIKVRLEHPIAKCMDLQVKLRNRFGLKSCIVVPSDDGVPSSTLGLAQAGAQEIEMHLKSSEPKVIAMGTGRVLRACVEELSLLNCEHLIDCSVNQRVASTPLKINSDKAVYAIAAGEEKVFAILGALRSKLINGLITNEYTAERLLSID